MRATMPCCYTCGSWLRYKAYECGGSCCIGSVLHGAFYLPFTCLLLDGPGNWNEPGEKAIREKAHYASQPRQKQRADR